MSCRDIEPELVGYHFGIVSDETRKRIEDHLVACPDCVRTFLDIKRDIEIAESGPQPSLAARRKLRRDVATELGLSQPRREWSWWERPLALWFAGVAVMVAMFAVSVVASSAGSMPHTLLDQASQSHSAPARTP